MDREKLKQTFQKVNYRMFLTLGVVALVVGFVLSGLRGGKVQVQAASLLRQYGHALVTVQEKIQHLRKTDEENQRLKLENSHLRLMVESLHFGCHTDSGEKLTHELESQLNKETGSRLGRTLASISYKLPAHLLPTQLHTLGLSYFKGNEDEKAAVIFTFLTNLEDDNTFKTPENHLLAGVSWYRLENLEIADTYFDKVLKAEETKESEPYLRQARLWKGVISERQGKHAKSQYWLREVLGSDPHSMEASWINNSGGVRREIAHEK